MTKKIRETTRMFYKTIRHGKPEEVTFEAYFRRYESNFEKDRKKWPDEKKVRLLRGKFGAAEHEKREILSCRGSPVKRRSEKLSKY